MDEVLRYRIKFKTMLLIYSPAISSRSKYIFELVFKYELGLEYELTTSVQVFENHRQEKINYSPARISDEFFIKASAFLFENSVTKKDVTVGEEYQTKVLFSNDASCDLGFDIFSAIFFMVSRYEEYLPFTPDKHGRFKATDSLAYKNNFLQTPVVDFWINLLKNILQKKIAAIKFKPSYFKALLTYDIDVAYRYKGRSFTRTSRSTIIDLVRIDLKNIYRRFLTLSNKRKDSWDVYDYLQEAITQNKLDSIFFFLLSDGSIHDRNLNYKNPLVKKLIDTIKSASEIGIHPSYTTSSASHKITREKNRLEKLSGKQIYKSRQHYLKFTLPETYNSLIDAGITEDYSMGFSSLPGFRAGTCKPFYFYDLKREKSTGLKIFPITFMDGAFIDYLALPPGQALQEIFDLITTVKMVNGTFMSVWHNHTVSKTTEYMEWRKVHDQMIQFITKILKEGDAILERRLHE